jgi:hypothetical protein
MNLFSIQKMQLTWVGLGLAYNAISWWRMTTGNSALSPTDPFAGAVFIIICGCLIVFGIKGVRSLSKFVIPLFALLLLYSGVGLHVSAFVSDSSLIGYASFVSWLAAVLINSFGVITLLMGSWFVLRQD